MFQIFNRWLFKSKAVWLASQEAKLQAEFAPQLALVKTECQRQLEVLQRQSTQLQTKYDELHRLQRLVVEEEEVLSTRRANVEQASHALREQLQLLEAKAAPDRVWVEAFSRGYETAWHTVWPIMSQGLTQARTLIEQKAIEDTVARLEPLIVERATALGALKAQDMQALLKKREELLQKQQLAVLKEDKARYEHYLTALDWMLDADGLHPHQSATQ